MGRAPNGTLGPEMGWARNGTGPKWDAQARNGMGPKWDGPKWSGPKWRARNGGNPPEITQKLVSEAGDDAQKKDNEIIHFHSVCLPFSSSVSSQ